MDAYNWRKAPPGYEKGWFDVEHQAIKRALAGVDAGLQIVKANGTNDTTSLLSAIAGAPTSGFVFSFTPGIYLIDATQLWGILFNGKSNFVVLGNGATIKVIDGTPVTANYDLGGFTNCQDFYVSNLILDGNRANRTLGAATGTYNCRIYTDCARGLFDNVRSINSVLDGWTLATGAPATQSRYPTDITLRNCTGEGSYRVGLSWIGTVRAKLFGGRYINSIGSSPEQGIDIEPDAGTTFGNLDFLIEDTEVSGNNKFGIQLGGASTTPNSNGVIRGLRGKNNGDGFANIANCDGLDFDFICGAHSVATRGIVDLNTTAKGVRIGKGSFTDITAATANNACIYVHSAVPDVPEINDTSYKRVACKTIWANRRTLIDGYSSQSGTYNPEILLSTGASDVRNASSDSATPIQIAASASLSTVGPVSFGVNDLSADRGDTSPTVVVFADSPVQQFATALTANRTVTLSLTNAYQGAKFRILRSGLGAFTLTVQRADLTALKVMPNSTAAFADVEFNGTVWLLTGYGTL